jgi:hypothetical protein
MSDNAKIIHGRPDFRDHDFGVTYAKKFPPFVFSIRGNSALIHKVDAVRMRWYEVGGRGEYLYRLDQPRLTAVTVCGMYKRLSGESSRTCMLPNPNALLCGRCHGEVPTFSKHGAATKAGITRTAAHVKLGCVVEGY